LTKNYEIVYFNPAENISDVRSVWKQAKLALANPSPSSNLTSANRTDTKNETQSLPEYEAAIVYGMNEIILTNLRHYQEYSIEV